MTPRTRLDGILLGAVLLAAVFWRMGPLIDERTWIDEDYVLIEAHGIHPLRTWPSAFVHAEVRHRASYLEVMQLLASTDVYPPLLTSILFAVPERANPIVVPRAVFLLLGLALVGLVHRVTAALKGPRVAILAAAYVSFSPLLTVTSQQLKWFAIAPILATAAAVLLLRATSENSRSAWLGYVVAITLLFHTHYFGLWAALGGALFVFFFAPHVRSMLLRAGGAIALICAPWYVYAFPRQAEFQRWYAENLVARPYDAWFQPLNAFTALGAHAYSFLAAVGLQPSAIRVRYMLPMGLLALACAYKCVTASDDRIRRVGLLAAITLGAALAAQTAYALRVGNTIPLSANYVAPWAPLFMLTVILGAQEWSRPAMRHAATAILVGFALFNVAFHHYPEKIAEAASLGDYREIATVMTAQPGGTCIAFRRDRDAKVTNLYYRGGLTQIVVTGDRPILPAGASRILFVSRASDPPPPIFEGWSPPRIVPAATRHARLELSERTNSDASRQP